MEYNRYNHKSRKVYITYIIMYNNKISTYPSVPALACGSALVQTIP